MPSSNHPRNTNHRRFIDKKQSVTYSLFYDGEDDDGVNDTPDTSGVRRAFVRTDSNLHVDDSTWYGNEGEEQEQEQGDDSDWDANVHNEHNSGAFTSSYETRRKEIIELGFPDDGYDYLQHMRRPGAGAQAAPATLSDPHVASQEKAKAKAKANGVTFRNDEESQEKAATSKASQRSTLTAQPAANFLPASDENRNKTATDVAVVDATRWALPANTTDESAAWAHAAGVTALSRRLEPDFVAKRRARDVDLKDVLTLLDGEEHISQDDADADAEDKNDNQQEERTYRPETSITDEELTMMCEGDLLDDFILTASAIPDDVAEAEGGAESDDEEELGVGAESIFDVDLSRERTGAFSSSMSLADMRLRRQKVRPNDAISLWSGDDTYQPPRAPRSNAESLLEERFEALALTFNPKEDGLGALSEEEDGDLDGLDDDDIDWDAFDEGRSRASSARTAGSRLGNRSGLSLDNAEVGAAIEATARDYLSHTSKLGYVSPAELASRAPAAPSDTLVPKRHRDDEDTPEDAKSALEQTRALATIAEDEDEDHGGGGGGGGRRGDGDAGNNEYTTMKERSRVTVESVVSFRSASSLRDAASQRAPRVLSSDFGASSRAGPASIGGAQAPSAIITLGKAGAPAGYLPARPSPGAPLSAAALAARADLGLDVDDFADSGDELDGEDDEFVSVVATTSRSRGETTDEKKARKAAVKASRAAARDRKRQTKELFKDAQRKRSGVGVAPNGGVAAGTTTLKM